MRSTASHLACTPVGAGAVSAELPVVETGMRVVIALSFGSGVVGTTSRRTPRRTPGEPPGSSGPKVIGMTHRLGPIGRGGAGPGTRQRLHDVTRTAAEGQTGVHERRRRRDVPCL